MTSISHCEKGRRPDEAISRWRDCFVGAMRLLAMTALLLNNPLFASEVIEETRTRVVIREHPKTGKPYVSIVSSEIPEPPDPFTGQRGRIIRPDYRMLDPKVKSGQIPYNGPVSDRTRVYIFAASLMTVGTVGGAMIWAAAPAATGAGASSGAGALLAGGTAVTAGSAATYSIAARPDSKKEDYSHKSEYQLTDESKKENEDPRH